MLEILNQAGPAIIAAVTPLAIFYLRQLWAQIPKAMVPVAAAIMGAGLDVALQLVTVSEVTGIEGALYGLAGVGLREIQSQAKKHGLLTKNQS